MLDEGEFAEVSHLLTEGMKAAKSLPDTPDRPPGSAALSARLQPALDAFERITGYRETNAAAIYHHRLSLFGPPCPACGRPGRTPNASRCVDR